MILIECRVCNSQNFIAVFGVYVTSLRTKSVGIPVFLKYFSNLQHSGRQDKKKRSKHTLKSQKSEE